MFFTQCLSCNDSCWLPIDVQKQCHISFKSSWSLKRSGKRRSRTGRDGLASCASDELTTGLVGSLGWVVSVVQSASCTTPGTKISGFDLVGSQLWLFCVWSWCRRTTRPSGNSTRAETGPVVWTRVPYCQDLGELKSFMNTGSLASKSLCLAWWLWVCCWCSCFLLLGTVRSSLVLSFLFIGSSAGVTPVVVCDVVLYLSRKKCDNLSCMVPSSIFSIPSFKALTAHSTCPFKAGWYGNTLVCLTPFFERKFSNSALVKLGPLSLTMVLGDHGLRRFLSTSLWWQLMLYFALCGHPSTWNVHQWPLNTCDLYKALHNQCAPLPRVDQATPMGEVVFLLDLSGVVGIADNF